MRPKPLVKPNRLSHRGDMAHRIDRILSTLVEFIARTWPVSKTKEQMMRDYQRVWAKADRAKEESDST